MVPMYSTIDDVAAMAAHQGTGHSMSKVDLGLFVGQIAGEGIRGWARSPLKPAYSLASQKFWEGRVLPEFMHGGKISGMLQWNTTRRSLNKWERLTARRTTMVYDRAREAGAGRLSSAWSATKSISGRAAISRAGSLLVSAGNIAFLAPLALEGGRAIASGLATLGADYSKPEYGTPMIQTEQAYTQRQAALQAIHNSQLQTRSFFMREAQAFHQ